LLKLSRLLVVRRVPLVKDHLMVQVNQILLDQHVRMAARKGVKERVEKERAEKERAEKDTAQQEAAARRARIPTRTVMRTVTNVPSLQKAARRVERAREERAKEERAREIERIMSRMIKGMPNWSRLPHRLVQLGRESAERCEAHLCKDRRPLTALIGPAYAISAQCAGISLDVLHK
jgi:hypothetical protein